MPQMRRDWSRNHFEPCRAFFRQYCIEMHRLMEGDMSTRVLDHWSCPVSGLTPPGFWNRRGLRSVWLEQAFGEWNTRFDCGL
jgi:hypothetical protein